MNKKTKKTKKTKQTKKTKKKKKKKKGQWSWPSLTKSFPLTCRKVWIAWWCWKFSQSDEYHDVPCAVCGKSRERSRVRKEGPANQLALKSMVETLKFPCAQKTRTLSTVLFFFFSIHTKSRGVIDRCRAVSTNKRPASGHSMQLDQCFF